MPMTKRSLLGASLSTVAALTIDGPVRAQENAPLVMGVTQVPRHFNGAVQSGTATATVSTQVFASPLRYDDQWNPQPYLAKSWELSPDALRFTLRLVDDAVFHDGQPVTSADVAFTIGVIRDNHPFQSMLKPVASVDTPDPHTVVINLAHPHPALMLAMSPALMPILPKHVYGDGQDIKTHPANLKPVGCGPYRFVDYKQGETIQLEKFDKFFLPDRPKLDRVVFRILRDSNTLSLAAERGEVNAIPFLTGTRDIERLSKAPSLGVHDKGFEGIGPLNWLAFNTGRKPLDDARVRRALCYAANREFMVGKLLGGVAKPAFSPVVPGSPFFDKDVEHYAYDLARAEKLLDEAGHKKGADGTRLSFTIDYIPGENDLQRNLAEYLRSAFKRVGVILEVRAAPDFPTWAQRVSNYDFDLTMDIVFNWGDPVIGVDRTYQSSNIRKGVIWSNTQQYSNPEVDKLLQQAAVEPDQAKRQALYGAFQKIVVQDAPIFFVNTVPYRAVYNKKLTDLPLSIWGPMSPLDEVRWA